MRRTITASPTLRFPEGRDGETELWTVEVFDSAGDYFESKQEAEAIANDLLKRVQRRDVMDLSIARRARIAKAALEVATCWFVKSSPSYFNGAVRDLVRSLEPLRQPERWRSREGS